MAGIDVDDFLRLVPQVRKTPENLMWLSYDTEADVLYVNLAKGVEASDSELTEDDVIIRYRGSEVIGYTILNVSKRAAKRPA